MRRCPASHAPLAACTAQSSCRCAERTRCLAQGTDDDVEVRWEDQQKICTFGRLNTRMHDIEEDIKEKRTKAELLEDAANELILADDDDPIR